MPATILQPGQIEAAAGEIPFLRLPVRESFFRDRAARFRQLAAGHTMGDFLDFMADLAEAQHAALAALPGVPLPDAERLAMCRQHSMAPLGTFDWQRDHAWREALFRIADAVLARLPAAGQAAVARLRGSRAEHLEKQAGALLGGRFYDMDLAASPFIAAALQTYWVHMATRLGSAAFGRSDPANLCPVCASPPLVSVVRIGGAEQGLRYLHCSLCGSEWHMVRAKCSNCDATHDIGYYGIENGHGHPQAGAVKAEACEDCGSYLKILYLDKDPLLDPTADDLANLGLDLLMDETGLQRSGPNLFLVSA